MHDLTVLSKDGRLLVDSRDVAEMIEKPHYDLIKTIRNYVSYLTKGNFPVSDFFIQSSYFDKTSRNLPCYLLTKQGCEMVANKMTGEKGILFTAKYVQAFNQMSEELKRTAKENESKMSVAEAISLSKILLRTPQSKYGLIAQIFKAAVIDLIYEKLQIPHDISPFLHKYENSAVAYICNELVACQDYTRAMKLYENYCRWCGESGETPVSLTTFGRMISSTEINKKKSNGVIFYSVAIREQN